MIAVIGSGVVGLAAARALMGVDGLTAEDIARRAMKIAGEICVYTNHSVTLEVI